MYMRYVFVTLFTLLLFGCHHAHKAPIVTTSSSTPADFTHINVQGPIDVTLHTGSLHPAVIVYADPRDKPYVVWTVRDGVLRVMLGKGYPKFGAVRVDISSHYLSTFTYRGTGTIQGRHLQSKRLDLTLANKGKTLLEGSIALCNLAVSGSGFTQINGVNSRSLRIKLSGKARVQLAGVANVVALSMKGHGWLSLYWVKSRALKIRAKDGVFIQMAGVADLLDIELWGKARFNGRYLRGTRTFVKTHNHAEADISVVDRQHAQALDASNIYFYNLPAMKADFMAHNGSVLDMREWDRSFMQEPTRYNQGPT